MAQAAAHKFGQIIGDALELAIEPHLRRFAEERALYLDKKGPRPARPGNKVSWRDLNGNLHDLDFVLERGGSPERIGVPVAFIETAWRRYTRHSRNKAQEIQGAIEPLAETHRTARPFKGAVLAGEFTPGALAQLRSLGFAALRFTYADVVAAFATIGIDATYDDVTPDAVMAEKARRWADASAEARASVANAILATNQAGLAEFLAALDATVSRAVISVTITPLHGVASRLDTVPAALAFVEGYDEDQAPSAFARYEIEIQYNNADRIRASFGSKADGREFLRLFLPVT